MTCIDCPLIRIYSYLHEKFNCALLAINIASNLLWSAGLAFVAVATAILVSGCGGSPAGAGASVSGFQFDGWQATAYLKAANATTGQLMGYSIALAREGTLVTGASSEDSNQATISNDGSASFDTSLSNAGAAYVFTANNGLWSQRAYLKAPNPQTWAAFGRSVAISATTGDTIVVGAPGESSAQNTITNGVGASADTSASNAGAAYVFVRDVGGNWGAQAYLKASNAGSNDGFGTSVAISDDGNLIAVGAPGESSAQSTISSGNTASADNSAVSSGAVYIFSRDINSGSWSQVAYLKASNAAAGSKFGDSLAIGHAPFGNISASPSNYLVVGATMESSNQVTNSGGSVASTDRSAYGAGAAYVFLQNLSTSTWTQVQYLKAPNAGAGDNFGNSVATWNGKVIVGAPGEASAISNSTIDNTLGGGALTPMMSTTGSADDSLQRAGAAYVYNTLDFGQTWRVEAYLKADKPEGFAQFGSSVAIDDNRALVGSPDEAVSNFQTLITENGGGGVYVYEYRANRGAQFITYNWYATNKLVAPNRATYQQFGQSVALVHNTTLTGNGQNDTYAPKTSGFAVVGANGESSNQRTVTNGGTASGNASASQAGASYVFKVISADFTQ